MITNVCDQWDAEYMYTYVMVTSKRCVIRLFSFTFNNILFDSLN